MRKIFSLLIVLLGLFLNLTNINAQEDFDPIKNPILASPLMVDYNEGTLSKLQKTKTLFLCREGDDPQLLQKALNQVWKITNITVIKAGEWEKYVNSKDYSFLSLNVSLVEGQVTAPFLSLWIHNGQKKTHLAKAVLYEDQPTIAQLSKLRGEKEILDYLNSSKAKLSNWQAGFIKMYAAIISQHLVQKTSLSDNEDIANKEALAELKENIIYVPRMSSIRMNAMKDRGAAIKDVFATSPFKFQVTSMDNLNAMLLDPRETFYFMLPQAGVSVYNGQTQELIYRRFRDAKNAHPTYSKEDIEYLRKVMEY